MISMISKKWFTRFVLTGILLLPVVAHAEPYWFFDNDTRYMALGDSLASGYGAIPATQGYVYLLYQSGVFDTIPNTIFCNAGVPDATSQHVLDHQVPQATDVFHPTVVTITVGGNDLFRILDEHVDPAVVLAEFQSNLTQILQALRTGLPNARIYISNLYTIPEIPGADPVVQAFNQIVAGVAAAYGVPVADVYTAFLGKTGLLLIERHNAGRFQAHPTNAGHRAMAKAFEEIIQ